jgi:imidazolonepropionase-like amidohydrolase
VAAAELTRGFQQREDTMAQTLFVNAQIFEGTERDLRPGEVLVRGNRVAAVAAPGERLPREGAEVIDVGGATLMPGLVNAHSHLTYNNGTSLKDLTAMPVEEHVLLTMHNAKLALDCGFTAVIGAAAAKPRLDIVIRNEIAAGRIPGPRMLACSPELTVTGGLADESALAQQHPSVSIVCDGPEEFRKVTRLMIREGADIVKFNNSGDSFCHPRMPGHINPMTEEEVAAVCDTAHNAGRRVSAHSHADASVRQCLRHDVEYIYHATYATEATIEQLALVRDRHIVSPAIAARYNTTYEASEWGITTDIAEMIGTKRELEEGIRTMSRMREAGIRVVPFGDYGFAWTPHGTDTRDLEHFVNMFGFEPWEVLRAATVYGAEAWVGRDGNEKLGRVAPGYLADLIVLDGNPLHDLTLFQDRANLLAIMKDGTFHKRFVGGREKMRLGIAAE